MFRKTFSHKVARAFEIASYIEVFLALIIISLGIASIFFNPWALFYALGSVLLSVFVFCFGIVLLICYQKLSRVMLDEEKIIPLWSGTFLFNSILFCLIFYHYYSSYLTNPNFDLESPVAKYFFLFLSVLLLWLAVAILLSVCAVVSELKNTGNVR